MKGLSKDIAEIKQAVTEMRVLQAVMNEDLKEHVRRTANLEGRTESIETHVHQVQGVFKFMGYIGSFLVVAGTVGAVLVAIFKK